MPPWPFLINFWSVGVLPVNWEPLSPRAHLCLSLAATWGSWLNLNTLRKSGSGASKTDENSLQNTCPLHVSISCGPGGGPAASVTLSAQGWPPYVTSRPGFADCLGIGRWPLVFSQPALRRGHCTLRATGQGRQWPVLPHWRSSRHLPGRGRLNACAEHRQAPRRAPIRIQGSLSRYEGLGPLS